LICRNLPKQLLESLIASHYLSIFLSNAAPTKETNNNQLVFDWQVRNDV
jgi:hypothetical protein